MARPDADRDSRLTQALRDNLKRRKDQARGVAMPSPEPVEATPSRDKP